MAAEALAFPSKRVDVSASLRQLADRINAGDYGAVRFAVCGLVIGGNVATFAWGLCSDIEAAGVLARMAQVAVSAIPEPATAVESGDYVTGGSQDPEDAA